MHFCRSYINRSFIRVYGTQTRRADVLRKRIIDLFTGLLNPPGLGAK